MNGEIGKIMDSINKNIENPTVYRYNYVPDTGLERFQKIIEEKYCLKFDSYKDLHKWTVENYTKFWEELWHFFEIRSSQPYTEVLVKTGLGFTDNEWFSGAKLNYAENFLRIRDDRVALIYFDELGNEDTVTFAEMFEEVKLYSAAFRKNGLTIGDRVACYMSNRKEAVFTLLAVASIGAIWGGPAPLFGAQEAAKFIREMKPKFLIAVDSFQYNGTVYPKLDCLPEIVDNAPSIEKVILIVTNEETRNKDLSNIRNCVFLEDFLNEGLTSDGNVPDIIFEQLSFNHPLHLNFTSGTTGTSKTQLHSAGTILSLMRDYVFSFNMKSGDTICWVYPVGWSVWESTIASLSLGVKVFLYSGSVFHNINGKNFWDILAKYKVNIPFLVTSMIDKFEKMGIVPSPGSNMNCLKIIATGGSPIKTENFEYFRNKVYKNAHIVNIYGATEMFGFFSGFNVNMPVYAGEFQVPSLGIDMQCFDPEGKPVVGQRGELVVCTPAVNFPLRLWKDEGNKRLREAYLSKYPGVWAQQDCGWINPKTGEFAVICRSDDTIKQYGERFAANDIYLAIHALKELQDYICVAQTRKNGDSRAILFVKMQNGYKMTPQMRDKISKKIHAELYDECVPELILEVPDIPYNINNKRMESGVRKIVESNKIPDVVNLKNPESLKHFLNIPEIVNFYHH